MNERERTRNRRNNNRRYAADYYSNSDQPRSESYEEWHRRTYGLPASGRMGQRRHDIAAWGNPSFTQNTTNRERQRFNDNRDDREIENRDNLQHENDYEYNRYYMGDQRGTWNRRGDESYNWGENSNRYEQAGIHRGKGPKGFTRSDERLREDINCRLTDDAYVDASGIDVTVENGEVTLSGTVTDRFEKRRAEDIAELVSGVRNVENRIRVK